MEGREGRMLSSWFSGGQRSREDGLSLEDSLRLSPEQEELGRMKIKLTVALGNVKI